MRQTQTNIDHVSAHITHDLWSETNGVTLSEKLTGTTRFHFLHTKHLERFKLVNGRPTKIQKVIRPDSMWLEAWTRVSKKQEENYIAESVWKKVLKLQAARHNKRTYEVLIDVKDFFKGNADARVKLEPLSFYGALRRMAAEGNRRRLQLQLMPVKNSQLQNHAEHAGANEATTCGPHRRNGTCGQLSRSFGT